MSPEKDVALDGLERAGYGILHFSTKSAKQLLIETVFQLNQLFYKLHPPKRLSKGSDELVKKE
jgi:hypothetical protein